MYKTKLQQIAEERENREDTRNLTEKLIDGSIDIWEYNEEIANQEYKYGEK